MDVFNYSYTEVGPLMTCFIATILAIFLNFLYTCYISDKSAHMYYIVRTLAKLYAQMMHALSINYWKCSLSGLFSAAVAVGKWHNSGYNSEQFKLVA